MMWVLWPKAPARARLASLFGRDQTLTGSGNEFFQYTAPKQPKKGQPAAAAGPPSQKPPAPAAPSAPPSVFIAIAVHAYRFANGQYVKQGKYGAAIVGSHATREYRLLLYISQQQQIASARIHPGFVFTVQPNNYGTFYDDQRQNWSVMFESEKAAVDFSKQLCIAKYNSSHSPDAVVSQDLIVGEGQGVEAGDALEAVFTGWLFQNAGLGQVFDSNVNKPKFLRLKLGSGKIIKGWEEGMIGMKKGGRRFLIIPPSLAYGSQGVPNRVPPDSTLAFEVDIKRVRLGKEAASNGQNRGSQDSLAPSPGPPAPPPENTSTDPVGGPPSTLPPKPGEVPPRTKSNSGSEQLTNPDAAKAKLISRMAKMGQPMLPFFPGTSQAGLDSSDSEIEDLHTLRGTAQPAAPSPPKPSPQTVLPHTPTQVPQPAGSGLQVPTAAVLTAAVQTHPAVPGTVQSFQPYAGVTYAYPQATAAASQLQPVGTLYPTPFQAGDIGSFLMTEARQQNTEIRLAVGKVADKIDQLTSKMEELQKQNSGHNLLPGFSSVTMETSMIMSNIQRVIQENERLKQEVFDKNGRIEEQNEKISELIARNQRYVEQSNLLMEQRNSSLQLNTEHTQARVLHAEQEKPAPPPDQGWEQVKVAEELAAATAQISRLQLELTEHRKKEMDLRSQLDAASKEEEKRGAQIDRLQAQLAELQELSEDAKSKYQAEKQSRKQLDGKMSALEEELADLRGEKEKLEKSLSERKRKFLEERKRAEEEMEEFRKSHQGELEKLRQLLKKSRTSTDQATSEQMATLQTELDSQWEAKCERLLATASEEHRREYQEACEQRDAQEQRVAQLEEKISQLKAARSQEEEKRSLLEEQLEQIQPMKEKYLALQSQVSALKAHYEERIQELQKSTGRPSPAGSADEVKRIMNGVFQSLRGQFELEDSYTGRVVLGIVMNTIKTITLQLLQRPEETGESSGDEEGPHPAPRQRPSPAALDGEPQNVSPRAALSVHVEHLEKEPDAAPPSEGSEPESAASEAREEQPPSAPEPPPVLNKEEKGPRETVICEQLEAGAEAESSPAGAADGRPGTPKSAAEETGTPQGAAGGGERGPAVLNQDPPTRDPLLGAGNVDSARTEQESGPSPAHVDASSLENQGDSFKAAACKPSPSGGPLEEEEEEELSLKGQPPPTPLFGDDDDDDDLDWLG
uniref:peptidylprolyl isomerase n=1 Tax=Pogona vitticeps TaxID=103695 RepID=A0ABM5F5E7_9SAUR